MIKRAFATLTWILVFAGTSVGQANGKLQLHFMDVGQGDGAVLISPKGAVVLFDTGVRNNCDKPISYLQQLGVTHVDYIFVSHYHADHIGCAPQIIQEFPVQHEVFDRGFDYPGQTYKNYVAAIGSQRSSLSVAGKTITLDQGANPVTIQVIALNGNSIATTNENDLSLVALISLGQFKAEIGGDLSGASTTRHLGANTVEYKDIESSVAPAVGHIDVYKVHHHCSSYSSNETWLTTTHPLIGIVSTGNGNTYGHPAPDCLERLHKGGVKLFWTETGNGGQPEPRLDVVGGNIVVEVAPQTQSFTVTTSGGSHVETFSIAGGSSSPGTSTGTGAGTGTGSATPAQTYAWSKNSKVYHYADCKYVQSIAPGNLQQSDSAPTGKTLHKDCPK